MNKLKNYFEGVKTELRKVSFPSREETKQMTILVIAVSIVIAVYVGVADFVWRELVRWLISS
jgi:preprotein translocase subunit SecE